MYNYFFNLAKFSYSLIIFQITTYDAVTEECFCLPGGGVKWPPLPLPVGAHAGRCASLSVSLLPTSSRLSNHFLLYRPLGLYSDRSPVPVIGPISSPIRHHILISPKFIQPFSVFSTRQHTDARYWYLSVRPSVRYVPVSDENGLTYRYSF